MPYLTNSYIFSLAPSRVPFLIRPVANMIFSTLNDLLVKPNLQANVDYVSRPARRTKTYMTTELI